MIIAKYASNDRICIQFQQDGFPYAILSSNVKDVPLEEDEFVVKSWSENSELWLLVKHLFENTDKTCNVGHAPTTPIWKLKPEDFTRVFG